MHLEATTAVCQKEKTTGTHPANSAGFTEPSLAKQKGLSLEETKKERTFRNEEIAHKQTRPLNVVNQMRSRSQVGQH